MIAPAWKWTSLGKLGRLRAMQMTAWVPPIGYVLLLNDYVLQLLKSSLVGLNRIVGAAGDVAGPGIPPDVPGTLALIYFGLVSLGLGSILFAAFCPSCFSDFKNDSEHLDLEIRYASTARARWLMSSFEKCIRDYGSEEEVKLFDEIGAAVQVDAMDGAKQFKLRAIELVHTLRVVSDRAYPAVRFVISMLYIFGFVLLTIPSVRTFAKVVVGLAA